ncbi:hypothetical protein Fcan01_23252 [Folsomia candida]|uniref:Peptidase A2 domain-containing protein n=1 Tax=Folsomia candida TaxID=158441 RepID=A0A226DBD9_FOLCA|nr:hypothetical protein Fcan01_23252 [Folsomia candida]
MKPEGAASQSAPSSEKASRKNTHIQREPTTSTRELTRRYPAKDFYLLPKIKKKNETWCNWGVTGDDHLPAVQWDGCGTWYHYEKNGEGMQHCDYTEGEETEEWYCVTCREEHQIFGEFDSTQLDDRHDKDKHHHPDNVHDNADGGFENLTHTGYDDPSLAQIGSSDNLEANFTTTVVLNVTEEEQNYIPPKQIDVTFSAESISKIYNYDTEKFVQEKKARGDELAQRLRESGILCAFKNSRAPYYYATKKQDQSFAKKEGYCSCGMKFNLIFLSKPVQGFPVKAKFLLQQHYHGHISIITVTSALQSHQHLAKERFDCNGFEDLKQLDQHNKITHNPNGVIKGYIQDYNLDPKLFRVDLFDQQSLKLLADKIAKEHVTLGIDATGGILKPLSNAGRSAESSSQQNSKNQPRSARPRNSLLLYSFVAQTGSGNFVAADSILMRGQYGFWVLIFMSAMMAINLLIVIMINVKGGDNNRQNVNINRKAVRQHNKWTTPQTDGRRRRRTENKSHSGTIYHHPELFFVAEAWRQHDGSPQWPHSNCDITSLEIDKTIGFLETAQSRDSRWSSLVKVDNAEILFKLDPGADVTVIPLTLFRQKWKSRQLDHPTRSLNGPDGSSLNSVGSFMCELSHGKLKVNETVYVIRGLQRPLLGLRACEDLNLVRRVDLDNEDLNSKDELRRSRQKKDYDSHHRVQPKEDLQPEEVVWVKDLRTWGKVLENANAPRSLIVDTPRGKFRRNSLALTRAHTNDLPETPAPDLDCPSQFCPSSMDKIRRTHLNRLKIADLGIKLQRMMATTLRVLVVLSSLCNVSYVKSDSVMNMHLIYI